MSRPATMVLVFAVALSSAMCSGSRAPDVLVTALRPIDGDAAVVVLEDGRRQRLARIDAHGRTRWVRVLPGKPFTIGPYDGLAIVGDVVTVRYGHVVDDRAIDHALAGYALSDGRLLWDTVIAPIDPRDRGGAPEGSFPTAASSLPVGDGLLAHWVNDGTSTRLYGVEAATGRIVSQQIVSPDFGAPYALGSRVMVNRSTETTIFDIGGKQPPYQLQTWFRGCVLGEDYVTLTFEQLEGDVALVALAGGDPARQRVIANPFHPVGHPNSRPRLLSCGRYRDRFVLLIETNLDGRADDRVLVVITDANGRMLNSIDLGPDLHLDTYGTTSRYPNAATLAGDLPRFAPYIQATDSLRGDGTMHLLMLDLEQGTIAWTGPADGTLTQLSLFRVGDRWYTFDAPLDWTLTVFEGRTGELTAATRLHAYHGIDEIRPYHVSGGRVWVYSRARRPVGAPSVAVLDAGTLIPVFTRGVETTDVTVEARGRLGLK